MLRNVVCGMALLGAVGCSGGGEEPEGPECSALAEACHEASEGGDAEAIACHDVAHEADEEACAAELDACTELCDALMATM